MTACCEAELLIRFKRLSPRSEKEDLKRLPVVVEPTTLMSSRKPLPNIRATSRPRWGVNALR
jgi:hypothetical protein